jgi:hypothetical protein
VERLPVRYAALACVIAGGMLMSGPGAVALADPPGTDGNGGGTGGAPPAGDATTTSPAYKLPAFLGLSGLASNTPRVGPIVPPGMNLPSGVGSSTASPNVAGLAPFMLFTPATPPATTTAPRWVAVTLPRLAPAGQMPSDQRPINASATGSQRANGESQPQQPGENSGPTISVGQVVPAGVPVGTPITNRGREPLPIDLHKPLLPQLLPPPVVLILMAIAERVPLAGLVITPLLDFTVPSFIADAITAWLSPTGSLGAPGATMRSASFAAAALSPVQASGPMPPDLGPTGMDMLQSPDQGPPPPPLIPELPKLPAATDNVSQMSEQVEFRAGYSDYLRHAGMAQITAIAVPGAVAILLFSVGGGFIGYRQARAGHVIRAEGIGRFLR